jgi:hypothetical protein
LSVVKLQLTVGGMFCPPDSSRAGPPERQYSRAGLRARRQEGCCAPTNPPAGGEDGGVVFALAAPVKSLFSLQVYRAATKSMLGITNFSVILRVIGTSKNRDNLSRSIGKQIKYTVLLYTGFRLF